MGDWSPGGNGGSLPALAGIPGYTDPIQGIAIIGAATSLTHVVGAFDPSQAHGNTALGIGWRSGLPQGGPLNLLTTGYDNTAIGAGSLLSVTSGHSNTALGADALGLVTTGHGNIGIGAQSGESISTGIDNIGIGSATNQTLTTGNSNIAIGSSALTALTTTGGNISIGGSSLSAATTAANNVVVGYQAGVTATPANATIAGSQNVFLGYQAGSVHAFDPNNAIAIGYQALVDFNAIAIGSGVIAHGNGAVAIGVDHTGAAASTTTQDEIKLGTASHTVNIPTTSVIGNGASGNLTALAKGTGGGPASDAVNAWIPFRNGATSGFIPFFV